MGPTFGKITYPRAPFERIQLFPFEVRTYPASFVAEITCNDEETIEASQALMDYIGLTGDPHNMKGKWITINKVISFKKITDYVLTFH